MDIFTKYPIKVNVCNSNLEIIQQYIWANQNKGSNINIKQKFLNFSKQKTKK